MSRDADLLPNPCHLLDTAWQGLDADDGYDSIQVDMTVEVDPGESARYYYSNTVYSLVTASTRPARFTEPLMRGSRPTATPASKIAMSARWRSSAPGTE